MASTDARPVPRKNAAYRFYFAIRKNDGTLITSWAGQDSELSLDGASFADCTNEATEIGTSGCGYIDFTASEMNADNVVYKLTVTNTSALPLVVTFFPEEAGDYRADVVMLSGDSAAADNAEAFFDGTGYAGTNNVIPTVTNTGTLANAATVVLTDGSLTAAKIAASALNGKGDWNTVAPDNASITLILADTNELQTNQGNWLTATGFSTHSAADVWAVGTRSLTTFGSLVSDVATAVWAAGTRTLTEISDSSGITTLLTYITGVQETKAQADTRQTALLDAIDAIEGGGGGGLTGPYARTIVITDTADDTPIEGALVRLYRTGETETKATDADGETTAFATGAYTYSYAVSASGYAGATGTIVISGDGETTIELTASSVTVPDDPALATLSVKCLDETGVIEPGAVVYVRIVGIPSGSTGLSFDAVSQDATAGSDGVASLTIVKLAKYQIRRGDSQIWKEFTATSASSQTIVSFIGVDPVVS